MSNFQPIVLPPLVEPGQTAPYVAAQLPSPDATPTFPLLCSTHKCREGREL